MTLGLLITAVVLILCIVSGKLSQRFGVPVLLLFILLGMAFGSDGPVGIAFENYNLAEQICSVALIFIIFYGGFGTSWKTARPVAVKASLLSTLGVVITAGMTGFFCYYVLNMSLLEGMLVGAILGSTDAASVFAILRSKRLNLKGGLAPLLEMESGSNDPFAYLLTVTVLTLMSASGSGGLWLVFVKQLGFGLGFGFLIAGLFALLFRRVTLEIKGLHTILVVAIALLCYAVPTLLGGNGYLSVYIAGIVLGNQKLAHKTELVHFFDGVAWLMQMMLFFVLGLLSFPSQMPSILLPAILITLFLALVARPAATFALLGGFRMPIKQLLFVSFAGLRGAASIVFAIYAINSGAGTHQDIFHIVFCVCLLSSAVQGGLLPFAARKLDLVDNKESVLKTFTDYEDDAELHLAELPIGEGHPFAGLTLGELPLAEENLIVLVKREDSTIIPNGSTEVLPGDILVMSLSAYREKDKTPLTEIPVEQRPEWLGKSLHEIGLPDDTLVVLIKREGLSVIPRGHTVVRPGDVLVVSGLNPSPSEVTVKPV